MADLSRIETFQYPAAHYGHLTDSQQKQLDAFRELCQQQGYYTPAGADGSTEPSHDDETLLRFLRARRFNPQEAFKQFKDTEDWRKEHGLNELFHTIEVDEFEQTRRLYPQWLGRRDKRGIPLFLFEVAPLNSKNIAAYEKQLAASKTLSPKVATKNLRLFALYESLTRFVSPLCSAIDRKHPETPISQSNNIVDISGVGLKQFWNLKNHMQDASVLATAHYPETLDRIFIIGAPAFFPTVWGWVKRWFDPITVSKIFILSKENILPTLTQYMDMDCIPKKYGGTLDFEWGNMPNLEPSIESAITWVNPSKQNGKNTFPTGPIRWETDATGAMHAYAVGHENGVPRHTHILTIAHPVNAQSKSNPPTITNTPIPESELRDTDTGTATQPKDSEIPASVDETPPSTESPTPSATPAPEAQAQTTELPVRQGTSDTRFEQQAATHASGQLESGTPHAAVNDHGHGDKTVTMEPGTVGQAPKDVDVKAAEPPAPGYVEQAQKVVAAAAETVTATVGNVTATVGAAVGGVAEKKEEEEEKPEKTEKQKEIDRAIDGKEGAAVEEFLRDQTASTAK